MLPSRFSRITSNLDDSLLKPFYKDLEGRTPLTGHCYVVSEAIYHLWGRDNGYKPHVMKHEGGTHWFLKRGDDIIDLTSGQFKASPDYRKSRSCGFLTKIPSKRAKILILRFEEIYGSSKT